MSLIPASSCHGARKHFPGRPRAGTDPWDWWWSTFANRVPMYVGVPFHDEPTIWAGTRWTDRGPCVFMHYALTPAQQRVALAHEMHHLAVGGVCVSRCPRNEAKIVRATSRWLIPDIADLADRLRRGSIGRAARDLGLPSSSLRERLACTTPTERVAVDEVMRGAPSWLPEARAAAPDLSEAS